MKLALIFQDHMTLQRGKPIAFWGTAGAGDEVSITVQNMTASCRAATNGCWRAEIGPLEASFQETIQIASGDDSVFLHDVQVGDVYLAAGQSNMEFYMRYDADFADEMETCTNDDIRFFDYPEVSYPDQINEADYGRNFGFWRRATADQLQWFSAPAYYFAKTLQARYGVPIGIVGCNWGGTPACAWMSEEAIEEGGGGLYLEEYREALADLDPETYENRFRTDPASWRTEPFADATSVMLMEGRSLEEILRDLYGDMTPPPQIDFSAMAPPMGPKNEKRPCGLYESMLSQVAPYGMRGILYYQGESDGDAHPELYATLFPALIRCFRRLWNDELPFLFVQLAPFGRWMQCVGEPYAIIREAQQHTADTVPGVGMAVITDIGMELDIHPKKKKPVGERLALLAEKIIYGEDVLCEAPTLLGMEVKDGQLRLRFGNVGTGLHLAAHTPDGAQTHPARLGGLTLALGDEELDCSSIPATADNDTVILRSSEIRKGRITAELGRGGWFRINLYNSADLPARPGRLTTNEGVTHIH